MGREAGRAIRRTGLGLLALACLAFAVPADSLPVVPSFSWNAGDPGGSPAASWEAEGGGPTWNVSGASVVTGTSALPGITAAYAFDGVGDRIFGPSFQGLGAATGLRTSFEIWFRPTDLLGGAQVLLETGGRVDGLSITLDDASLLFRVQDDAVELASLYYDLTSVGAGEFIQVVGAVDLGGMAELFVNGASVGTTSAAGILDWAGGGSTGVGDVSGRVGGTNGPGEGDLFGYGSFAGEIAILRYYEDELLDATEVAEHYVAIVANPEPETALLLAMGLIGLTLGGRPRPTAAPRS